MNRSVIASFVAAALMSSTAFAATHQVATTALHKRVAKAQAVVEQNSASSPVSSYNWANRISIGGLINVEGAWGDSSRPLGSFTSNVGATDFYINNANLFVDANINPWIRAHVNLVYLGNQHKFPYRQADRNSVRIGTSRIRVDEAYLHVGNFARTPFYALLGKGYVPFGHYNRYPVITPLTQLFSQTRATAINLGVVTDMGFYANVYAFNGPTAKAGKIANNIENFGAKVGYFGSLHNVGLADVHYDVNASWIRNFYDVDLWSGMFSANAVGYNSTITATYPHPVQGLALHGDLGFGNWDFSANWVGALSTMTANTTASATSVTGRIWAADLNGGYKFKTCGHNSRVGLSAQFTSKVDLNGNSAVLVPFGGYSPIPKVRLQADYTYNLWNHTDLTVAYAHNISYKNGSGNRMSTNEVIGRIGVAF